MLNHTLLGVATGDFTARQAMVDLQDGPRTTDWCVGGCDSWKDSESGIARYKELAARWKECQVGQNELPRVREQD